MLGWVRLPPVLSMQSRSMFVRVLALSTLLGLLWAPSAWARQNGLTTSGCGACHTGGRAPTVTLTMDPMNPEPGTRALVRVRISAPNGGGGGFYLHAFNKGTFTVLPGQGARAATDADVVHASPKPAVDGTTTFEIGWTPPMMTGTADLEVYAVSGNGNGAISGDGTEKARLTTTVGCAGIDVFVDTDNDGFGSDALPKTRVCQMQMGYSLKGGDCNDYLSRSYPGAPELCNEVDDDCDGMINEGLESATLYRDADGDGYGDFGGTDTRTGCSGSGYSPSRDDCNDSDRTVNPGAKEVCNTRDDNCNGRVDEGAKLTCGVGWCRQTAASCDSQTCEPSKPRAEECNLFDDDCDGVVDNGASCPGGGKVCYQGRCLASDDAKAQAEAEMMSAPGPGGADGGSAGGPAPAPVADAGTSSPQRTASQDGASAGLRCTYGAVRVDATESGLVSLGSLALLGLLAGRRLRRARFSPR